MIKYVLKEFGAFVFGYIDKGVPPRSDLKSLTFMGKPPLLDADTFLDPSKATIHGPADVPEWRIAKTWQGCPVIAQ